MPYPSEYSYRLVTPDKFSDFRRVNDKFGDGVHAIFGLKDGKTELQAIRFDKKKFSESDAKKWLADHKYKGGQFHASLNNTASILNKDSEYKFRELIKKDIHLDTGNIDDIKYLSDEAKRIQFFGVNKQIDLAYGSCILVSEGTNANGLHFTRESLIAARETPKLKPVNIEHNQDFIVGVIYDSAVALQKNGNIINDNDIRQIDDNTIQMFDESNNVINEPVDIVTNFVIWKYLFPQLSIELLRNQQEKANLKYFVSMEVFYNDFGYMFDNDASTLIKVNDDNFDIYYELESYVGKEFEDGRTVQKVINNYVFGGMGITETPANHRSYLLDLASQGNIGKNPKIIVVDNDNTGTENKHTHTHTQRFNANVEEEMDKEKLEAIERAVNKLMAANASLDESSARIQVLETEVANLSKEKADAEKRVDDSEDKISVLKTEIEKTKGNYETAELELKNSLSEKEKELEAVKASYESVAAELSKIRTEKVGYDRIAELESAGIKFSDDRKQKVFAKVSIMTDEDYASYKEDLCEVASLIPTENQTKSEPVEEKKEEASKPEEKAPESVLGEDKPKDEIACLDDGDEDEDEDLGDEDGMIPNLHMENDMAAEFQVASASSAKGLDISDNILEAAFKAVTTRDEKHGRGNNYAV
jgi:TolA-binding protein